MYDLERHFTPQTIEYKIRTNVLLFARFLSLRSRKISQKEYGVAVREAPINTF
ncbi:hypothetical protein ECDEC5A_1681 [Escherichia coli DEC5A]|nr:hypothetical protein ECDEC5A_1681 [Escherichia coli DEC5A]EMV25441.1 hypothetical protein ECBCE034MS14_1199 [Escherichia coli BCE034_MS-14]